MPNKKRFETIDINALIFGEDPKMLSMVEIADAFYRHIEATLKYLSEGKTVVIEIPNDDAMYHLSKKNDDIFILEKNTMVEKESFNLGAIHIVNWLFENAPFISVVGYSNL
jgi:hypothetical protein